MLIMRVNHNHSKMSGKCMIKLLKKYYTDIVAVIT